MSHRWLVRALLGVATIFTVVAIFAVWANRQVLDADNWAETSTELLEDDAVRTQVAGFLVDEVYANVDVTSAVADALPDRFDPFAGTLAGSLRQVAENRTERVLGRPRVQTLWEEANRLTVQQFINIAEGDSKAIARTGDAVVLDLRSVVVDLATQFGIPGSVVDAIPEDAGRIEVMRSDQVGLLQDAVGAVKGLSALLPGIAVALFALAVWLARDRRRKILMAAGFCWISAGLVVLIGRSVAGSAVVDALTTTEAARPAAEGVWSIGTEMLGDVAEATVIMGLPVVLAAWIAGPSGIAVGMRRTAAPWLRDEPALAYGVLAAVLLLIVAWGPIHATRMPLPVLLMTVLAVSGLAVLRRQVAREFPETTRADVMASVRGSVRRAPSRPQPAATPPPREEALR